MENYLLMKPEAGLEQLSKELGFTNALFLDRDIVLIKGTPREILNISRDAHTKKRITLYEAETEEQLRFVLESTSVDLVMGMEKLFGKDSTHYPKAGMDQVLMKIAASKGKTLCFSFSDLLNSGKRPKLMHRVAFNLRLCKKYKVKVLFSNFSRDKWEIRAEKDLEAVFRILSQF
ncbi:MAG: hypothetical protein WCV90_04575 [Candidatus Woesearchaeota archaeon]